MPAFIIRNIAPDLWAQFKARADREGHRYTWVFLRLVERYIEKGLEVK